MKTSYAGHFSKNKFLVESDEGWKEMAVVFACVSLSDSAMCQLLISLLIVLLPAESLEIVYVSRLVVARLCSSVCAFAKSRYNMSGESEPRTGRLTDYQPECYKTEG